jgi:hypothetical protein
MIRLGLVCVQSPYVKMAQENLLPLSLIAFGSGPGKCELQLEYDTYPDGSFFALTFAHLAAMAFRAISRRCSDVIL